MELDNKAALSPLEKRAAGENVSPALLLEELRRIRKVGEASALPHVMGLMREEGMRAGNTAPDDPAPVYAALRKTAMLSAGVAATLVVGWVVTRMLNGMVTWIMGPTNSLMFLYLLAAMTVLGYETWLHRRYLTWRAIAPLDGAWFHNLVLIISAGAGFILVDGVFTSSLGAPAACLIALLTATFITRTIIAYDQAACYARPAPHPAERILSGGFDPANILPEYQRALEMGAVGVHALQAIEELNGVHGETPVSHVCAGCLVKMTPGQDATTGVPCLRCPSCGNALGERPGMDGVGMLVAVLDSEWKDESRLEQGVLYVNYLARFIPEKPSVDVDPTATVSFEATMEEIGKRFQSRRTEVATAGMPVIEPAPALRFDRVEVYCATDEEVSRFTDWVISTADTKTRARLRHTPCQCAPSCQLSGDTIEALRVLFGSATA